MTTEPALVNNPYDRPPYTAERGKLAKAWEAGFMHRHQEELAEIARLRGEVEELQDRLGAADRIKEDLKSEVETYRHEAESGCLKEFRGLRAQLADALREREAEKHGRVGAVIEVKALREVIRRGWRFKVDPRMEDGPVEVYNGANWLFTATSWPMAIDSAIEEVKRGTQD